MALIDYTTMPPGIFRSLLEIWLTVRTTFVKVIEWMTENTVGGTVNSPVLSALIGGGLFAVLAYSIVKWIIP